MFLWVDQCTDSAGVVLDVVEASALRNIRSGASGGSFSATHMVEGVLDKYSPIEWQQVGWLLNVVVPQSVTASQDTSINNCCSSISASWGLSAASFVVGSWCSE